MTNNVVMATTFEGELVGMNTGGSMPNSMFAEELKDCQRWAKFAKRFGLSVPTEAEILFKAHQMSTTDGVAAYYDQLRKSGLRLANKLNARSQADEQAKRKKLQKLFQQL
jgi:hypothetical protein